MLLSSDMRDWDKDLYPTFQPRSVLMTTAEFIITLFYRIDNQMLDVPKHPRASLYPSEVVVVTLGVVVCAQRRR